MVHLIEFEGSQPDIDPTAWVAPTATLIGKVRIGPGASVFYGAVLRGDIEAIELGSGSNLQDGVIVHTDIGYPAIIGANVGVGHGAIIHGARVGAGALIGMGATLLSGSIVGAGAFVAAGALVREGFEVPPGQLAVGVPAKVVGPLDSATADRVARNAIEYQHLAGLHARATRNDRASSY